MRTWTWLRHWLKVKIDDPRYPRRGAMRVWRLALLLGWWLIGLYLGTVAIDLLGLLRLGPERLIERGELVPALLLPQFLADPRVPVIAFAPFVSLFALLIGGGLWAARDAAAERAVRRADEERRIADRVKAADQEAEGASAPDVPSLRIISIDGASAPRREPLLREVVTVGRDTTNAIVLSDRRVSRKQLRLSQELYYWRGACERGAAKLYINGVEQTTAILRPHDQLMVGATMLRFEAALPATTTVRAEQVPRLVVTCAAASFTAALREPRITLGREVDCGIFVPSRIVSRHHAELIRTSVATYEIRDMESENGLCFAGQRVPSHVLRHSDTITIGAGADAEMALLRYLAPESLAPTEMERGVQADADSFSPIVERIRVNWRGFV